MIFTETMYVNRQPIGVVRRCTNSRQIAFSPIRPPSKLPPCEWSDIDELKAAVIAAYSGQDHG